MALIDSRLAHIVVAVLARAPSHFREHYENSTPRVDASDSGKLI